MILCNQCGAPLANGAKFCGECGAPMGAAASQHTTKTFFPDDSSVQRVTPISNEPQMPSRKVGRSGLMLLLFFIVGAAVLTWAFVVSQSNSSNNYNSYYSNLNANFNSNGNSSPTNSSNRNMNSMSMNGNMNGNVNSNINANINAI